MKPIDIIYLRKDVKDGLLIPYIKKDLLGNEQVYIKNQAGEVISIGTVDELKANWEKINETLL